MYVLYHNGGFVCDEGLAGTPEKAATFQTLIEAHEHAKVNSLYPAYVMRVENIGDGSSVYEAAKARGLQTFDTALPQAWVDKMHKRGMDVRGHFVWCYDGPGIFGYPHPITHEGEVMAGTAASSI